MGVRTIRVAIAAAAVSALGLVGASQSFAAFPGTNGKIAFHANRDGSNEIYVMNARTTSTTPSFG